MQRRLQVCRHREMNRKGQERKRQDELVWARDRLGKRIDIKSHSF